MALRSIERVSAEPISLEVVKMCVRKRGKNAVKEGEKVVHGKFVRNFHKK